MDAKTIFIMVIGIIWTLFGASITAVGARYLNALKKDKNLGLLATWASQAVAAYQKSGLPNEQKKEEAIKYVVEALKKNNKLKLFSSEQISAAIEVAVNLLNAVIVSPDVAVDNSVVTTTTTSVPVPSVTTSAISVPVVSESSALSSESAAPVEVSAPIASESQQ